MTAPRPSSERPIAWWLLACCAPIYAMVILGGVTRLTHSGLSMVEWHPVMGVLPPMSHHAWEAAFKDYQRYPEYQDINKEEGMTLQGFKGIFWLEYFHRLLGRLIGLVFFLPFVYFLIRKRIRRSLLPKLVAMLALGGLQGILGWLMVSSGLVNVPHVSAVRLTAHLGLAILIYGFILWVALGLLLPASDPDPAKVGRVRGYATAVAAGVFVMILSGGLVAGTRAGFAFNTFPLMLGHLVPPGFLMMHPWWHNLFANVATVQFDHRLLALILTLAIPALVWALRRSEVPRRTMRGAWLFLGMLAVQVGLGIATLLLVVPVPLAALHQAGAVMLFTLAIYVARSMYPVAAAETREAAEATAQRAAA